MPILGKLNAVEVVLEGSKALALIKSAEVVGNVIVDKTVSAVVPLVIDKTLLAVVPSLIKEVGVHSIKSGITGSLVGAVVTGLAVPVIKKTPNLLKRTASATLGYDKGFLAGQKLAAELANKTSQTLMETVNVFIRDCSFEELFQVVLLLFSKNRAMSNLILILRPVKSIVSWGTAIAGVSGLLYYGCNLLNHYRKVQIVIIGANQLLDKCLELGVVDFKEYKKLQLEISSLSSIPEIQDLANDLYIRLYPTRER